MSGCNQFILTPKLTKALRSNGIIIIIIIIIIQEISIAHNPQLKVRAHCAHRKTQNKYLHKNKKSRAHHDQSYNLRGDRERGRERGGRQTDRQTDRGRVRE